MRPRDRPAAGGPAHWQTDSLNEDLVDAFAGQFEDYEPMSDEEIDALCERLNFGDGQVVKGAAY